MSELKKEISNSQKTINTTTKELDGMGNSLEKSGKDADDAGKKFEKFKEITKTLGKGLATAVTAIGASAVVAGKQIWSMANDVSKAGDEIDKESQKLGISAESYQTLSYAMERSGTDIGAVSKGMVNINKELSKVQNGAKGAGKQFEDLGVSLKNADGSLKSSEQVLFDSIDALAKMEDETQRNAYAQQIFGKSYQELAPLLNSGSEGINALMQEAKDYGMVMSDEAVTASATFQDSLTKMNGTISGLKNNMIGQFLPSLTMIVDGFTDLIAGNEGASESIKNGVGALIENISSMIPQAVTLISTLAEAVLESAPTVIQSLADGILEALPTLIPVAFDMISQIATSLIEMLPEIVGVGMEVLTSLIQGLTDAIPDLIAMLPEVIQTIVTTLLDNLDLLIDTGIDLLLAIIDGLVEAIPQLIDMLPTIIETVVDVLMRNLPKIISAGIKILAALINGIVKAIPQLISMLPRIITTIVQTLTKNLPKILQMGVNILKKLISGIGSMMGSLGSKAGEIVSTVFNKLSELPSKILGVGKDLVRGLWNGISDMTQWVIGKIKGFGNSVLGGIKSFFGIKSPSKVFEKEVGVYLAKGIGVGFEDEMKNVTRQMENAIPTSFDTTATLNGRSGNVGGSSYYTMVDAFKEALSQMKIELDDDEVGRFIDKTVTRLVYS